MFLCGFPTELANIIDFAQAKSNKKIGQTRFSSTCFESRLSLKGGGVLRVLFIRIGYNLKLRMAQRKIITLLDQRATSKK